MSRSISIRKLLRAVLIAGACLMTSAFSLDNALVPRELILSGGPPRDGIPAILSPKFLAAGKARFLEPGEQVLGVEIGGRAKAYPIKILTWHEVVNDTLNGVPIVVTY